MIEPALSSDAVYENSVENILNSQTLKRAKENGKDFAKLMAYYECAMMEIETKFNVLNVEYSLKLDRNPINSVKTRLKKVSSIIEKLHRLEKEITLSAIEENILDVAGVRVICGFTSDVYTLADSILKQDDITLVRTKDYIQTPKPNGYRSLHLIVSVPIYLAHEKRLMNVEIQLRTISMDSWASLEHQMRYKKDVPFTDEMAHELLRCAHLSAELDARMDKLGKQTGCRNI